MGNCCGGLFRSQTSGSGGSRTQQQTNNLSRQRTKREQNWAITGQIALRDGNLKELPGSIGSIGTTAKVLDATNNKLTTLPLALADLANLQRLILGHNALTSLPNVLQLRKLKVLVVDHNRLTELPAELGGLSSLEKLQCSHNVLNSLPASLGQLAALTQLDCSSNKISDLPPELGSASRLEHLNASDNYLREVPESLQKLLRLVSLVLDQNQINAFPSVVLKGCGSLQTLSLHDNPIKARELHSLDGYEAYEKRRRGKVDKQILGGAAHNLDEGVDRNT